MAPTLLAPDRQATWTPRWLVELDMSVLHGFQDDAFQAGAFQMSLVDGVAKFAGDDMAIGATFYHGRLVQDPIVERQFFEAFWGLTEVSTARVRLADTDGDLDDHYLSDLRWAKATLKRYDRESGTTITELTGVITQATWETGIIEFEVSSMDLTIFEDDVPKGRVDATTFSKAVDMGATIPVIFGNVDLVPCPYVNDDTTLNQYDYLVGRGALTVSQVYRNGPNNTLWAVNASEYTVSTVLYAGLTVIRFTQRQVDFSNAFHVIYANVTGLAAERNFARAVKTLLSDTTYGLSQTVNAASFTAAEAVLDGIGTFFCDGAMTGARPAQNVLQDLMLVRGMRLAMNASGEWTISVDQEQTNIRLAVQDGIGDGEKNLLRIGRRQRPPVDQIVKNYYLRYRFDGSRNAYRLQASRALVSLGRDRIIEHPFIRNITTADKVVHYLAQRELFGQELVEVDLTQEARQLTEGELVTLTYPPIGYNGETLEVRRVRKQTDRMTALLGAWSAEFYTYAAGTLPTDPTSPTPNQLAKDIPAVPTGLALASATALGDDGTVYTFLDVSWNQNTEADLKGYELNIRRQGDTNWTVRFIDAGSGANREVGIIGATTYEARIRSVDIYENASAWSGTVTHATAADSSAPATPTGLTATASPGIIDLDWTDNTELDLAEYGVYRHTVNTPAAATKIAEARTSRFVDATVVALTTYYYWVTAFDTSENESAKSTVASATAQGSSTSDPPANPAAPVFSSEGVYGSSDGITSSFFIYTLPAMPTGGAYLNILLQISGQTPWQIIDQVSTGGGTVRIDHLVPGITYLVALQAFSGGGGASAIVSAAAARVAPGDATAPAVPTGLVATAAPGLIELDWNDNTEADFSEYGIYRHTANLPAAAVLIAEARASRFVDTNTLVAGTTYYYWLTAIDRSENASAKSTVASAVWQAAASTTAPADPGAPVFSSEGVYTASDGRISAFFIYTFPVMPSGASYMNGLFRVTGQTPWQIADQTSTGAGTFRIDDLIPGTTYDLAVQAYSGGGTASVIVTAAASRIAPGDTTAPAVPTGLAATAHPGLIELDWADNTETDFSEYGVYRHTADVPGAATEIAQARTSKFLDALNLTPGTTYYYWVTAYDTTNNQSAKSTGSSAVAQGSATSDPPANPTAPVFSSEGTYLASDGRVSAFFIYTLPAMPTGAAYLNVLFQVSGQTPWQIADQVATGGGTVRIDDLVPGITYIIALQAYSGGGGVSAIIAAAARVAPNDTTAPGAPTGLVATAGNGYVDLDWADNTEGDLSEYGIYRNTVNNPATATEIAQARASRFIDASITGGTTYYYWITAYDRSENQSSKSLVASATPTAAASTATPSDPSAPTFSSEGVYQASDGRTSAFFVYTLPAMPTGASYMNALVQVSGQTPWQIVDQVSAGGGTVRIDDLVPGVTYLVALQAFSGGGTASAVVPAAATRVAPGDTTAPAVPTGVVATAAPGLIELDWNDNTEADFSEYGIYRHTANLPASAVLIAEARASRFVDTDTLVVGTTYYYWITAIDRSENASAKSTVASAVWQAAASTTAPSDPSAPVFSSEGTYTASDGRISAFFIYSFPAMPSGASYLNGLFRITGQTPWQIADQVSAGGGTFRIDDLVPGQTYDIAVQAWSGGGGASAVVTAAASRIAPGDTTAPGVPTGLTATANPGFIDLDWTDNTETDFSEYGVYRHTADVPGSATEISQVRASRFVDAAGLVAGTTYYYWVTAYDNTNNQSAKNAGTTSAVHQAGASTLVPSDPAAPTKNTDGTYQSSDGSTSAFVVINMPAMPSGGVYMNVLFRLNGQTIWQIADQVSAGGGTVRIDDLIPGQVYEVGVQAFSSGSAASNIVGASDDPYTMPGDTTAPGAATAIALQQAGAKVVQVTVTHTAPSDWGTTELYRHTADVSGAASLIDSQKTTVFNDQGVSYGTTYYYWVKIVDLTGNKSGFSPSVGHSITIAQIVTGDVTQSAITAAGSAKNDLAYTVTTACSNVLSLAIDVGSSEQALLFFSATINGPKSFVDFDYDFIRDATIVNSGRFLSNTPFVQIIQPFMFNDMDSPASTGTYTYAFRAVSVFTGWNMNLTQRRFVVLVRKR